ncbi:acidic fibroblast growth factor intracellular-binding protein isoform X3 [Episyrphus balteatus]|uniref:acidic fibroblast growth factor intracellular-binding protein isoform X3 n=1 Tax=Episyrphus balteatus TaxID=286459 RepID=UPI002484F89C|nr:acidic fibroblast growth factor intracellular-binding protein isoform X3 [Episyrphus balteatus]
MNAEIDVFISNYTLIDSEIFQQWVEGYSTSEASLYLKQKCFGQFLSAHIDLIVSDILDQFRTYSLIERLLYAPVKLSEQSSFQLEPKTLRLIIEKYYSIDDSVAREILGKKLSSRYRKDLDEVSEKTFVKLKSCRRQFDNVKRIFKAVEELPGNITSNIKQQFMLSDTLAKKYASIVFLACIRFETSKKKLNYLSFSDFFYCSQAVMEYWTYTYQHSGPEYYDTEMDKEFLLDLRELRCLFEKEKEIKQSYWRSIITIAINLHRNRELRALFADLSEKLVDPWKQNNWCLNQVKQFLDAVSQSILELEISRDQETRCLWDRYMQVIIICLERMYHS